MLIFLAFLFFVTLVLAVHALGRANEAAARAERLESLLGVLRQEIDVLKRDRPAGEAQGDAVDDESSKAPKEPMPVRTAAVEPPPLPPLPPQPPAVIRSVPVPVPPTPASESSRPDWRARLREGLRRLHLLPPEQATNSEVSLAGWWSTRIGALLGVIAAVFFGVYVNSKTSPALRFAELLAVAVGVTLLGRWLEKKLGRYGEVISACGLALLYVTAFGGYALPAVRVFTDPLAGVAAQLAAVSLMTVWSWWKRDAHLAALALLLGYVSCAFADFYGVGGIARSGLLAFAVVGALLYTFKGWRLPLGTAMGGSFLGMLLLAAGHRLPMESATVSLWLTGMTTAFVLIFSAALWSRRKTDGPAVFRHYLLAVAGLSALAAFGGLAFYEWENIEVLYGVFTVVFGGMAFLIGTPLFTRADEETILEVDVVLFQTLFLKASTYLALFIVTQAEGPVRSIAVTLQALGVLWTARRSLSLQKWLSVAVTILWITGHGLFWFDVGQAGVVETLVYVMAAIAVATLRVEWIRRLPVYGLSAWMSAFAGTALVGGAVSAGGELSGTMYVPLIGGVIAAGLFAQWRKHCLPWVAGIVALLGGHAISYPNYWYGVDLELLEPAARWGLLGILLITPLGLWAGHAFWPRRSWLPSILSVIWVLPALKTAAILALDFASGTMAVGLYASTVFVFLATSRLLDPTHALGETSAWRKPWPTRLVLALLAGAAATAFTWNEISPPTAAPWALLGIAYAYLVAAGVLRDLAAVAGAAPPALMAWLAVGFQGETLWHHYTPGADALLTILIVVFFLGISLIGERRWARHRLTALGQILAFLALYQWSDRHLAPPAVWAFMAGTTCLAGYAAHRFRFSMLKWTAWFPSAYALAVSLIAFGSGMDRERFPTMWFGSVLLFGLWLNLRHRETNRHWTRATGVFMWIGLLFAALRSLELPWLALGSAAVSVTGAFLFQRRSDVLLGELSKWTTVLTGAAALLSLTWSAVSPAWEGLAALLPAAVLVALQGWMLRSASTGGHLFGAPVFLWAHATVAFGMAFLALVHRPHGVAEVATALSGIAAILLFLGGLFGGLRPYRFIGLSGMAVCIARVFIYDLQDTFYRIIAFAATAVLLLVVGYLYTRFRGWIEEHDASTAPSEGR